MRVPWVLLAAAFAAVPSFAATVSVGCPGGSPGDHATLGAALGSLDAQGPHTINVSGTCVESVLLNERERLTINGPATIQGPGNATGIIVRSSSVVALRNLVVRGQRAAISVENLSQVTLNGVVAENATLGNAIDAFGGALVNGGGPTPADAVTMRNSSNGMRCERCTAFFSGGVTIENNTNMGLFVDGGRVEFFGRQPAQPAGPSAQGAVNLIRNNVNGVVATQGGVVDFSRENIIQNNLFNGFLLTAGGIVALNGAVLPDGVTTMGTIVEGNPRSGIAALFNSTLRATGPNRIRNNGSAPDGFRSGITASHNSMLWLTGGFITGTTGPGIFVDSGSTARLLDMTMTGNTEANVRVVHGGIVEAIGGNAIPSPSIECDGTAIVFGDTAGIAPFECAKDKKK